MKKIEAQTILENTLNKIKILDIHTHLFPPQHENYYLSGLVETLNYHYLIAELFVTTNIDIHKFKSLDKLQKAEIVWNELFNKRTPISEACKGVLTIFNHSMQFYFNLRMQIDCDRVGTHFFYFFF